MLVLARKKGERIRIMPPGGPAIWITVVQIDGGKCRLGIDAPTSVGVWREELVAVDRREGDDDGKR